VIRNRLQAMLARRNLQPTSGKSWLTQRGQRELKALPLAEAPSRIREDCAARLPHPGQADPPAGCGAGDALGAGPLRAAPDDHPRYRALHCDGAGPRVGGHPPLCQRQTGRQLRWKAIASCAGSWCWRRRRPYAGRAHCGPGFTR
jgi:hypothetical protein